MRKVIGATKNIVDRTRGIPRRWAVILTLAVIVAAGLVLIQTVLAVHRDGFFELDGNIATTPDAGLDCVSFPAAVGCGDDWENIARGTSSAVATTGIVTDPFSQRDTSIFTTGGSKDIQDVSEWLWTTGSVPDKDEILDAYAARYGDNIVLRCR